MTKINPFTQKPARAQKSRYNAARKALIFWTLFIGVGALGGAFAMFFDPSGKAVGMDEMLPYFGVLPFSNVLFRDLLFPGIALLIVNGLTNLSAAVLLIMKKRAGVVLGGIFGVTLMLWICIQFYIFPPNVMSTAYFIFGFLQAVTGYAAYVFLKQEEFTVNVSDYKNIGKNGDLLVVYFSRMGYVKKAAYDAAEKAGACIYEIKSTEMTEGTAGFLWCGRFGMHRWDMPTALPDIDLSRFRHVTVCSPIWVFSLAAPVRDFLRKSKGLIKEADYILLHHTNGAYLNAVNEADSLLNLKNSGYVSIRCRKGVFKTVANKNAQSRRDESARA